jgi:two-component system, NtrC family, nitrogen regulation response regulator NtrX
VETVLIVEDEASVRATLQDWLTAGQLDVHILVAADAAAALELASRQAIDLAILDWNLGAGLNGLQLLEDLHEFQRDIVAILVTGYAHKATPLDALRLGVRDYLDKNHDLTRDRFLAAVRKQLDRLRPLKRERQFHAQLERFRAMVHEVLPRLETATALQGEGVPLDDAVKSLLKHARQLTGATAGLLVVRRFQAQGTEPENLLAFDLEGERLPDSAFGRYADSLAAAIASMAPESVLTPLSATRNLGSVRLLDYESQRKQLLGSTLLNHASLTVVLELFDKEGGQAFTTDDKTQVATLQPVAAALLAAVLGERESQRMLYDTLHAALQESHAFVGSIAAARQAGPAARQVFTEHVSHAGAVPGAQIDAWAELLQRLTERYGPGVSERALDLLRQLERILADVTNLSSH